MVDVMLHPPFGSVNVTIIQQSLRYGDSFWIKIEKYQGRSKTPILVNCK